MWYFDLGRLSLYTNQNEHYSYTRMPSNIKSQRCNPRLKRLDLTSDYGVHKQQKQGNTTCTHIHSNAM